jgi:hypothetical protein
MADCVVCGVPVPPSNECPLHHDDCDVEAEMESLCEEVDNCSSCAGFKGERDQVIRQRDAIIKVLEKSGQWKEVKATVEAYLSQPRKIGVITKIGGG